MEKKYVILFYSKIFNSFSFITIVGTNLSADLESLQIASRAGVKADLQVISRTTGRDRRVGGCGRG